MGRQVILISLLILSNGMYADGYWTDEQQEQIQERVMTACELKRQSAIDYQVAITRDISNLNTYYSNIQNSVDAHGIIMTHQQYQDGIAYLNSELEYANWSVSKWEQQCTVERQERKQNTRSYQEQYQEVPSALQLIR